MFLGLSLFWGDVPHYVVVSGQKIKFSCACHSVSKGHKFSPLPNFCENHRNEVQSRKQHFEQNWKISMPKNLPKQNW